MRSRGRKRAQPTTFIVIRTSHSTSTTYLSRNLGGWEQSKSGRSKSGEISATIHLSSMGQALPADSRSFAASLARIRRGIARSRPMVPHGEDHILEHPALAPSNLDLAPWKPEPGFAPSPLLITTIADKHVAPLQPWSPKSIRASAKAADRAGRGTYRIAGRHYRHHRSEQPSLVVHNS
jgi:hypothetical protein